MKAAGNCNARGSGPVDLLLEAPTASGLDTTHSLECCIFAVNWKLLYSRI